MGIAREKLRAPEACNVGHPEGLRRHSSTRRTLRLSARGVHGSNDSFASTKRSARSPPTGLSNGGAHPDFLAAVEIARDGLTFMLPVGDSETRERMRRMRNARLGVKGTGDHRGMPLGYPALSLEDIQLVESWIAQGRPRG